jgi:hypothetical protein
MDRLAVHVIATAALTLTLATVPVLFADACHASSSALPPTAPAATHASSKLPPAAAIAVLPALSGQAQTQTAPAAAARSVRPAPAAPGAAPAVRRPGLGRVLLPELPPHPCVEALAAVRATLTRHQPTTCHAYPVYS